MLSLKMKRFPFYINIGLVKRRKKIINMYTIYNIVYYGISESQLGGWAWGTMSYKSAKPNRIKHTPMRAGKLLPPAATLTRAYAMFVSHIGCSVRCRRT